VSGRNHHVQRRVVDTQSARFGKGIEQIEALLTFLALLVGGKRGALEKKKRGKSE
jgi:hypothetical protein